MFCFGKFEENFEKKNKEEKQKERKGEKKKLNSINYFYIFIQTHFTYYPLLYKN